MVLFVYNFQMMEHCVLQNNALNIYEHYFEDEVLPSEDESKSSFIKVFSVFRYLKYKWCWHLLMSYPVSPGGFGSWLSARFLYNYSFSYLSPMLHI